jgi:hypothetical protein
MPKLPYDHRLSHLPEKYERRIGYVKLIKRNVPQNEEIVRALRDGFNKEYSESWYTLNAGIK